jgi:Dolichyl-phosphate-mannose-protein mannosyltransferase
VGFAPASRPLRALARRAEAAAHREPALVLVAAVFIAGLALRVWFVAAWHPAFVGFWDAGSYIATAQGISGSPVRPLGYPIFLRGLHAFSADLNFTIVVQHALGLASAALLYLTTFRLTGSRLAALVPAAFILFDGLVVVLEHTVMSEPLFIFLAATSSYAAVRSLDDGSIWAAIAGSAAAAAAVTRPVGFLLVPIPVLALLLWRAGGRRVRLTHAGLATSAAVGVFVIYLGLLAIAPGDPRVSLSPSSGRVLYSRVAPFADCGRFDPPAGTQALCEAKPSSTSTNYYLWDPHSPAWRRFGPPPAADGQLRSFALAALTHQPGDYVSAVASDFRKYFNDTNLYVDLADDRLPVVIEPVVRYYTGTPPVDTETAQPLLSYARTVYTAGDWPMLLLVIVPVGSLLLTRGRERQGTAILAATGWLLLIGAVATAKYDPRYGVVAIGALAAASAPGLAHAAHLVARGVAIGRAHAPHGSP